MSEQNPFHVTVDCSSGEVLMVQLSDEEVTVMASAAQAHNDERAAREAAKAEAVAAIKASKDPAIKGIAHLLGLQ